MKADVKKREAGARRSVIERVAAVGILGNVALTAFKLFAGLAGRSGAMISDAVHSLSDVLATLLAYIGVTVSDSPADKAHPYGHDQIETLASAAIGLILLGAGASLGCAGIKRACFMSPEDIPAPTLLPLIAALVSIAVKEAMYHYTRFYAVRLNSSAFMADAWHHRSDALSSIGALVGIVGARMGFPRLDAVAAVVISLFIIKAACDVLRTSLSQTVDAACPEDFENSIRLCILSNPSVDRVDLLRTRKFGSRVYVEVEIAVDGRRTLYIAHRIAHEVHNAVEKRFPTVKHIMVHVNPTQLSDMDGRIGEAPEFDPGSGI